MRRPLTHAIVAALLGATAALLVACGSSGKGLIPASAGEPLQSDIEAVDQAAREGNGNCSPTEAALLKTDQDFQRLPASLNSGLHNNLKLGIENLHKVAKEACLQPLANTTSTAAPKTTTAPPATTTPATTPTTTTPSTTTTPPTTTPSEHLETPEGAGSGGGTPAPGEGAGKGAGEAPSGEGKGDGHGNGNGGKESGN